MNYITLTSIPLFTGISGDDLALIMDKIELVDVELLPGETFVRSGDVCHGMAIVREGEICRTRNFRQGTFTNNRKQQAELSYTVEECIGAPLIIEPEILFGLDNRHANSWTARTTCRLTLIGKNDIRQTLMYVPIWRINFINMLSTHLQRAKEAVLPRPTSTEPERIVDFMLRHTSPGGRSIAFGITLEQLCHHLATNRQTLTPHLDRLVNMGVVERRRNKLIISDINRLKDLKSELT